MTGIGAMLVIVFVIIGLASDFDNDFSKQGE